MILPRTVLASINSAMQNNQATVIIKWTQKTNFLFLTILRQQGFIQSFEKRGPFIIIYLRQVYRNKWNILEKSFNTLTFTKRIKNNSCINAKQRQINIKLRGDAIYSVISTDIGIIDSLSRKYIGGIPLFTIN